jgi:hypothetical protein
MQGFQTYGAIAYFDYDDGTIDSIYVQNNSWYNCVDTVYYRGSRTVSNEFFGGNITSNPLLVSTINLRISDNSPAIDAGQDVGLATDYEGNLVEILPDIGAYEYQYPTALDIKYAVKDEKYQMHNGKLVVIHQ